MINYLKSENLKYKGTFSRKFIIIAPCFFILFSFFMQSNLQDDEKLYMQMVYNWWPVFYMTMGLALICALSISKDNKSRGYETLCSYDIDMSKFWLSKILIVVFYMLISTLALIMVVFIMSLIFHFNNAPFLKIFSASFLILITSIGMIPVYMFLSKCFGTAAAVISGIAGSIIGACMAPKASWIFIPWSWAARLMCPIIGVHPNGISLPKDHILRDPSVIPVGTIISMIFFVATCYATCIWFSKREVR